MSPVRFTKNRGYEQEQEGTVPNSEMSRLKVATKVAKLFTGKIDVTRRYSGLSVRPVVNVHGLCFRFHLSRAM